MHSLLVYVLSNYSEGQDSSLLLTINMWLFSKDRWVYLHNLAGRLNTGLKTDDLELEHSYTWKAITNEMILIWCNLCWSLGEIHLDEYVK